VKSDSIPVMMRRSTSGMMGPDRTTHLTEVAVSPGKGIIMDRPDTLIRLLPPYLHWHPDGEIRLVGHRIGLYHFVFYYNQGYTAEMMLGQFPTLELALIHKVIAFYLDHQKEVDEYVGQYRSDLDYLRAAGPHAPSVVELRKRLKSHQPAESVRTP
jgi:uncharacterized protein (DUF433 family)